MKKIALKTIIIVIIIVLSFVIYKLTQVEKKGTIEAFLNLNEKEIKYIICDGNNVNTDEFIGIYWYKVFKETTFDNNSNIKKDCKAYNQKDKLLFELIELDNNTYLFYNKDININDQIDNAYIITK